MVAEPLRPNKIRLAGQRAQQLNLVHYRLMVVMLIFVGLALLISVKLAWLTVTGTRGAGSASGASTMDRADIFDRNGVPLARTISAWSIGIYPKTLVNDPSTIAKELASVLTDHDASYYYSLIKSGRSFVYLRRRATPDVVSAVNALGEPAIALGQEPQRLYPQATLAAHVLGWTDTNGHGVFGMEKVLDHRLLDPKGQGKPVALSIDIRVQSALESSLGAAITKYSAVTASGIVMDVKTGEVIAMASFPTFNPNAPGHTSIDTLRNNMTQSVYELGSTYKAITIANAMQTGVVTSMAQKYDATAPLQVGRFTIHDEEPAGRWLNIPEMMVRSSNIVTARISEQIGADREKAILTKLGMAAPPEIELTAKAKPLWPAYWSRTAIMTVGYGHGIAVTPLNLAIAYAALVNGGVYHPATLLKRGPDNPVPEGHRVISEETSARVRQLLRLVVLPAAGGTGKRADVPGFRLGGKTGTASKAMGGGYAKKINVSTFAGVFPMDDPRYVIMMTIDSPHATADTFGQTTAGWVLAPSIGETLSEIGPLLGVIPDESRDVDENDLLPLIWHPAAQASAAGHRR